ncbi:alpha/beta-hydrolase N-terminal domain-containing protein [Rhodococcus sp. BP22]|uniref:alpha/beta-hydrolase N-terminal domain-containing protein n=1 Tax=Rhodococcus sp. BP22 TaxID=2758566 RepID=UPI0028F72392|nr:alpha/beta-hydrolase N-terminal domain-containing protein [Rhodococcus sp. BP22]
MSASTEEAPNSEHSPLDESNPPPNKVRFGRVRHWLARFNPIGLIFALAFYCWSMSPSLLPRPWHLQAVASGVSAAIGYGVGALVLWLLHKCGLTRQWSPRWQRAGWITIGIVALVVIPTFLVLGSWWQDISRELVGVEPGSNWDYLGVFAVGAVVFLLCLLIGRGLRLLVHLLDRFVDRFLPAPIALGVSALVVTVIVVLMIEGILSTGITRIANGSAAVADKGTADGVVQPTSPECSGSPDSLEAGIRSGVKAGHSWQADRMPHRSPR